VAAKLEIKITAGKSEGLDISISFAPPAAEPLALIGII
jgi:hypothetical protein